MGRRWASLTLAASAFTLLGAAATPATSNEPAAGLTANAVTTVGSSYLPGTVVIREGDELSFLNVDALRHSVTSKTFADDGLAVFDSGFVAFTGRAEVRGVSSLRSTAQGYAFSCRVHPWMQGTLFVL